MEKKKPYLPPDAELADVMAIKALFEGTANEGQQKRALAWIINEACATYGLGYFESERDDSFAAGKRFVGQQLVKLVKANAETYRKREKKNG